MKSTNTNSFILVILIIGFKFSSNTNLNGNFVCDIVKKLSNSYQIDTLSIFRNKSFENDFPRFKNVFKQLMEEVSFPQVHFVEFSNDRFHFNTNLELTLSIIFTGPGSYDILNTVAATLSYMHISKIMIILNEPVRLVDLKYLLTWLEDEKFFTVLVFFEDRETGQIRVFSVDPFPSVKWLNQTDLLESGALYPQKTKDFRKYRIEAPYIEDVPRVFSFVKDGRRHLVGRNANIIISFAKYMNIELVIRFQPDLDLKMVLEKLPTQKWDLSLHSYSMFYIEGFGWSYPLDMVHFCVIVPMHRGVSKNEYFVAAFDVGTWIAAGLSVVIIAILMRFVDLRKPAVDNLRCFFRSLTLMMYTPNMSCRMQQPTVLQFVFYTLVFILAFVLSCFYSTFLTSFCTEKLYLPPIETVDDLVKANLRIMIIDYELETVEKYSYFGEKFLQLLYPLPYFEVIKRRDSFDHNYAYTIQQDRWYYLHKQQRGLKQPMFRMSNLCFGPHYLLFPLRRNSYLQPYLFEFLLKVQQSGLDSFWEEEAFRQAVTMNQSKVLVDRTVFVQPLDLIFFEYVFAGWFCGLVLSLICFLDELLRGRK